MSQLRYSGKRWGKVASITATSEGIVGHHAPRKEVSLEWDEIRLLEEWQATSNRTGYCLYANDDRFIEWRIGKRFSDPAPELVGQRHDALLALATAHTRLPIRTLVRTLAAPAQDLLDFGSLLTHVNYSHVGLCDRPDYHGAADHFKSPEYLCCHDIHCYWRSSTHAESATCSHAESSASKPPSAICCTAARRTRHDKDTIHAPGSYQYCTAWCSASERYYSARSRRPGATHVAFCQRG